MWYVSSLSCMRCGLQYDPAGEHHLCSCGSPLRVDYDLKAVGREVDRDRFNARENTMWRFRELLPVHDHEPIVTLGEGGTPLLNLNNWGAMRGMDNLLCKDEGCNPTGSFKCRGASAGITRAKQLKATDIALPSAGNAGGAWSLYAAKAGMRAHVAVPADTPQLMICECDMAGADVQLVDGIISDAGAEIGKQAKENGWYDAATMKEPYRVEGKKTMGYELVQQLNWQWPDVIVYPCGGGVGLIGIYKAWQEMNELRWAQGMPRFIAVQAEGCAPIATAFANEQKQAEKWVDAHTIAAGIRVPGSLADFHMLDVLRSTGGGAVTVNDDTIVSVQKSFAQTEGLFVAPEGAAAVAGIDILLEQGLISKDEQVVIINTGSGLKYV